MANRKRKMCCLFECDGVKRSVEQTSSVLWGGDVCVRRGRMNERVMGGVKEKRIEGGWEEQGGWGEVDCPMRHGWPTSKYMPTCKNTHLHTQECETDVFLFWTKCFQEQWEQAIKYVRDHEQCTQTVWSIFYHPGGVYFVIMTGWLDRIPLIRRLLNE